MELEEENSEDHLFLRDITVTSDWDPLELPETERQRSISLPYKGSNDSWGVEGLLPKYFSDGSLPFNQNRSRVERISVLSDDAHFSMLALKADGMTLISRQEFQKRQKEISLNNAADEIRNVRAALSLMPSESVGQLEAQLDNLVDLLNSSVLTAQVYGRLKYENKVSRQLDTLRMYADDLVRSRENIANSMESLLHTPGGEYYLQEIRCKVGQEELNKDSSPDTNSSDFSTTKRKSLTKRLSGSRSPSHTNPIVNWNKALVGVNHKQQQQQHQQLEQHEKYQNSQEAKISSAPVISSPPKKRRQNRNRSVAIRCYEQIAYMLISMTRQIPLLEVQDWINNTWYSLQIDKKQAVLVIRIVSSLSFFLGAVVLAAHSIFQILYQT